MTTAQEVRSALVASQAQISKAMGLAHQSLISLWETGGVRPGADNAVRYVVFLAGLALKKGRFDLAERLLGSDVWILDPTLEPPDETEYLERDVFDARQSCVVSREFTAEELVELGSIAPHLLRPLADAGRNTVVVARAFAALGHKRWADEKDCAMFHLLAARAALKRGLATDDPTLGDLDQ